MRSRNSHLVISGAGIGPASHMHHDLLSFECWVDGQAYIVDPGTYLYTASPEWRNAFRSTAMHNTLMVDGQEQTRLLDDENLFPITPDPSVRFTLNRWSTTPDLDAFDAEHSGYARLTNPVIHRRQIWFEKRRGFWAIRDLVTGIGEHTITGFLHLAPIPVSVPREDPWTIWVGTGSNALAVGWNTTPGLVVRRVDGSLSHRYGVKVDAPVILYEAHAALPIELTMVLVPRLRGEEAEIDAARQWVAGQP